MMDRTEVEMQVLVSADRIDKDGSWVGDEGAGAQSGDCLTRCR